MSKKSDKIKDVLPQIDDLQAWSKGPFRCFDCLKVVKGYRFSSRIGFLCPACVEKELLNDAYFENPADWPILQLLETLADGEFVYKRLIVLWRFDDVLRRVHQEAPNQGLQFLKLVIRNMGFVRNHVLAQRVRKAAYEACLRVGKPLTPILIPLCETTPWQYYANVLMTLAEIDPTHPEVTTLLKQAREDPRPEISQRVKAVLADPSLRPRTKVMLVPGYKKYRRTSNKIEKSAGQSSIDLITLVGKTGTGPDQALNAALQSRLEEQIGQIYNPHKLKQIYTCYFQGVKFPDTQVRLNTEIEANWIKKAQLVRLLATLFTQPSLFPTFFSHLSPAIQSILYDLVWNKGEREVSVLEKQYGVQIMKDTQSPTAVFQEPAAEFALFVVNRRLDWHSNTDEPGYRFFLSLPDQLGFACKPHLPLPKGYDLQPVTMVEPTASVYVGRDRILSTLKLYLGYVDQGNLRYAQNTGKVIKSELVQMAKHCRILEFFPDPPKELQYLKTALIIDFLQGVSVDTETSPEILLRQLFDDFFANKRPQARKLHEFLSCRPSGFSPVLSPDRQKRLKNSLRQVLQAFPDSQWIDVDSLHRYCLYRDIDLQVLEPDLVQALFTAFKTTHFLPWFDLQRHNPAIIDQDAITRSFLKTMFFLFAAFDLVDIAYDLPSPQPRYENKVQPIFRCDGLRYARLTPLGAFVLGRLETYKTTCEVPNSRLLLDDKRLLITIEGYDPLKTMTLEKLAEKIGATRYKVSYKSFFIIYTK